jgi:hypothetical protein
MDTTGANALMPAQTDAPWHDFAPASLEKTGVNALVDTTGVNAAASWQYADTAVQFLPALLGGPESLALKLGTRVLAPAIASETAGQLTKDTAAEPYARFAGAVLGGGLPLALRKLFPPSATVEDFVRPQLGRSEDDIHKFGSDLHRTLGNIGRDIAEETGVEFVDRGPKTLAGAKSKIKRNKYDDPGRLTDVARATFVVRDPEQADAIINGLNRHFDLLDEKWVANRRNYLDRKILIRRDDGTVGEIQIVPDAMAKRSDEGHPLYELSRKLGPGAKRDALEAPQRDLYAAAAAELGDKWETILKTSKQQGTRIFRPRTL